jgi:Bacteriophage lambda head decoration protein D
MDLSITTETFTQDDQSWLGSQHGTDTARSITLDTSAFTAGTHYPNGYFPSGLALGKITATGLYGPYSDAAVDGRTTLVGFLFTAVKAPSVNTIDVQGAILLHGFVVEAKLPSGHGLDANGKTDVKGQIIFV